jgi:hypothetical protein
MRWPRNKSPTALECSHPLQQPSLPLSGCIRTTLIAHIRPDAKSNDAKSNDGARRVLDFIFEITVPELEQHVSHDLTRRACTATQKPGRWTTEAKELGNVRGVGQMGRHARLCYHGTSSRLSAPSLGRRRSTFRRSAQSHGSVAPSTLPHVGTACATRAGRASGDFLFLMG